MKFLLIVCSILLAITGCDMKKNKPGEEKTESNKELATLLEKYYEERLQLFPLEATAIGDTRYNDLLRIDFTDNYRAKLNDFYTRYLAEINKYKSDELNEKDKLSYDVFSYELGMSKEGLAFRDNYIPFNQFYALPLTMGQLGSGAGNQPFKTVKDYDDWVKRATEFSVWADSAIAYFKKGIDAQFVLPGAIVKKMIPQMDAMSTADVQKSIFYAPVSNIPATFSDADKKRLTEEYTRLIKQQLEPAYKKLNDFLKKTYLPAARASSGIDALPGGSSYYAYLVKQQTTTDKTPEEIYSTGLQEVARIKSLMDSVKNSTGFKGDLSAFFEYMKTDKKFMPYKTPKDVLDGFEKIHQTMLPQVKKMFNRTPKTPFEIRQTEAFRAASASAEYFQGSPDGTRPGIFYVPIIDATTFNTTSGMESLFLHEAIPGHHYQISLQQEDTTLPKFRRYGSNNAYVEGWALYCESLGKELGLYTDPYQYMGALGDEMHRAIRLVVDVAIHAKGMSREDAIKYMMENEAISLQGATAEIERYMVIPGQALGYKIGALKIKELREKYEKQLGTKFNLAVFHDEILKDGSLPLSVLEKKMDVWANNYK
ncbi:MAG TPA: DUF885 domain-containing protein [Chitinophagaceae bacterium]|nr:DUF885 domain-containing protein [Chitinophagaceae bacterium]